jgi:hypothetical protein
VSPDIGIRECPRTEKMFGVFMEWASRRLESPGAGGRRWAWAGQGRRIWAAAAAGSGIAENVLSGWAELGQRFGPQVGAGLVAV